MNTSNQHRLRHRVLKAQEGASLLFALMALVILSLGALSLTRSVDTGSLIVGNLSFKQDTVVTASGGTEQAITWLQNNINNPLLNADQPASGYYASSLDRLDPTGTRTSAANKRPVVNWDGNCLGLSSAVYEHCDVTPVQGTPVNGNRVRWVITRICDSVGPASGANLCLRPAAGGSSSGMERGELSGGGRISGGANSPYYRVLVRVEGPRSTVSYTETLIHF